MKISENKELKFGRAVLVGRPNTGKSTLLNAIMNQKVAITSPLPQTTRKNTRVLFSSDKGKIIFSDTPGIFNKVEDYVSRKVNLQAPKEILRADVVVCLVDISRPKGDEENKVIGMVRKSRAKKILVYNKVDIAKDRHDYLPQYNFLEDEFDACVAISALKDKHVKQVVNKIFELLPTGGREDIKADIEVLEKSAGPLIGIGSNEYISELVREKAYLFLRKEIPYSVNIEVTEVKEKKNIIVVSAKILTTNERYKKMIIGKGGRRIKEIGFNARKELELMSGKKVYLDLWVETDKHWPERVMV